MANDAEKLEVISRYYRLLDEEVRRRLDRIKQSDGIAKQFSSLGYSQILEHIYEIHLRHEQVKDQKCFAHKQTIEQIKADAQHDCLDEIKMFIRDNIGSMKKTENGHD
jgi:23S rRNA maturation mini-RNase III